MFGERQRGTVSEDGAGRIAGSGLWDRGVDAEGLGQAGMKASLARSEFTPQQQSLQVGVHQEMWVHLVYM